MKNQPKLYFFWKCCSVPILKVEVHCEDLMTNWVRKKFEVNLTNRSPGIMRARSKNNVLRKTDLKLKVCLSPIWFMNLSIGVHDKFWFTCSLTFLLISQATLTSWWLIYPVLESVLWCHLRIDPNPGQLFPRSLQISFRANIFHWQLILNY